MNRAMIETLLLERNINEMKPGSSYYSTVLAYILP